MSRQRLHDLETRFSDRFLIIEESDTLIAVMVFDEHREPSCIKNYVRSYGDKFVFDTEDYVY